MTPVRAKGGAVLVPTGQGLFGRVLDGLGRPIDGKGPLLSGPRVPIDNEAPNAMKRARIDTALQTGVRVLDTMTTLGQGQRMGLFAGSGVGKSSLLSMIARGTDAEVSVIALVGERGREVREFLEDDLGAAGLARSVVVVATSDEPALMRMRAAFTATRIAESFRDQGQDVVLMMDSLTRVAMAQREIGLSVGEPPATRGYPPSTFSILARLLERAGTGRNRLRHRHLHRAGRRRRPQRAHRRRRPLHPRRPRRPGPQARRHGALPVRGRARIRVPGGHQGQFPAAPRRRGHAPPGPRGPQGARRT